ncbi:MAG: EamA family transporter [Rhodospirillales bacterium]|nr:EamA family transporter [Rhodospirillales bacterium]
MTTATRSEAIEGALWMTATMALAAAMTALIRFGAADMHPFEVAFFRAVFGVLFLLPWHAASGTWRLPSRMFPLHLLRAVFTVACMLAFFWAVTLMPIAEATALSFTTPLIATMGAAVFLKEHVGRRRWMGVAVGFAGVLLILRPGFESLSFGAVLVLFSAVTGAGDWLTLRPLARRNPTRVVVTWLTLLMVPLSLVPALVFWTRPSVEGLLDGRAGGGGDARPAHGHARVRLHGRILPRPVRLSQARVRRGHRDRAVRRSGGRVDDARRRGHRARQRPPRPSGGEASGELTRTRRRRRGPPALRRGRETAGRSGRDRASNSKGSTVRA